MNLITNKIVFVKKLQVMNHKKTFCLLQQRQQMTGEVAFTAFDNSGDTSYNAGDIIQFRQEVFDEGNHYDHLTSQYTCPVSGIYLFRWVCIGKPVTVWC